MKQYNCELTEEEISTILAALHFYQESGLGKHGIQPKGIRKIATNGGKYTPLDDEGIRRIFVKLNQDSFWLNPEDEWPDRARCDDCDLQADFEEFLPTDGRTHLICPECGSSNCFDVDDVQ